MGLFGGHHHQPVTEMAGIRVQTSLMGVPLPIVWGRTKIGCNLIDYVHFVATPHTSSSGGGKGFGGGGQTSYSYTASVILALCEGPITGIPTVYKDTSTYSSVSAAGLGGFMTGSMTQTPWSYLTSAYPSHALSYHGFAYVYAQDYALSSDASLSNHSFEVDSSIQFNPAGGIYDANPKDILNDFFTNTRYGVSGWGSNLLGDWTDYSHYCIANGLFLSPVLDSQRAANDFVKTVLQETNSDCFWSEGVLKIKTFGDTSVTGNGVTWNPNLTPIYDLNEDDFLGEVTKEIVDQSSSHNIVQIEYLDRSNAYAATPVMKYDLDDITQYGPRKQDVQTFHDICDKNIASLVAQLWLQRQLYVRDLYHFDLPMDFVGLEPMDYVTLTTTVDGMLLNRQLVMILSIDEDGEGSDTLHLVAEGVAGVAHAATYAAHNGSGYLPNPQIDGGGVTGVRLLVPPQKLAGRSNEAWAAVASNANSNWGGANVWISADNTNYELVGQVTAPGTFGTISSALANHADPDSVDTMAVDLTQSLGSLVSVTNAEADLGARKCLIDGEVIYFATAALTAANKYNVTYLRRGMESTSPAAHTLGANWLLIDDGIFKFTYPTLAQGKTVYVKFQSFNVYGRALQDLSACTAYSLALPAITTDPSSPSVTAEYRSNIIRYTLPNSLDFDYVQIFRNTTNNSGTATLVGKDVTGEWTDQGLTAGTTYYYWIQSVDYAGGLGTLIAAGNAVPLSIALYEGIGSDSVLTPAEKLLIDREWTQLQNEKSGLDSQASSYGITTEATNYDNAYNTLNTYLTGLSPAFNDTTQNTNIVRATWNTNWENLYSTRIALINKIDAVAGTLANWSGVTGPGTPDPGATGGDNYQPDPNLTNTTGLGGTAWVKSGGVLLDQGLP